jgi:hypothetical protein
MHRAIIGTAGAALFSVAIFVAQPANAAPLPRGNYSLVIPGRSDFHTWIWYVSPCTSGGGPQADCVWVTGISQPVAKALNYGNEARLADGHFTLIVDDTDGLRCGNIYYGTTSTTHDVYTWDPTTMAGTLTSSFAAGCDGAPGTLSYPFSLVRM